MKTLALFFSVLVNAAFLAVAAMAAATVEVPVTGRAVAAAIAIALGGALTLLLLARLDKLPHVGPMRCDICAWACPSCGSQARWTAA